MSFVNREYVFLFLAFIFIFGNQISQFWVTGSADLDQSEQLLFSQYWSLGYGAQPPLYTYLVNLLFIFTGKSLLVLLALKAIILFLLILVINQIANRLNFSFVQRMVAIGSFVLIPQFVWESQRDLTHSPLTALLSASLVYVLISINQHGCKKNFVFLGAIASMLVLAKYSSVLVLVSLFISVLLISEYRKNILYTQKFIITLVVFTLMVLPHVYWALSNIDVVTGSLYKLKVGSYSPWIGIKDAVLSLIAFFTPLWIVALILIDYRNIKNRFDSLNSDQKFLFTNIVISIAVVLLFVLISGSQEVKDRWYQPLMVTFPLVFTLFIKQFYDKKFAAFFSVVVIFMVLISFALPARTVIADAIEKYSRPSFPLIELGEQINGDFPHDALLVGDRLVGGNLVLSSNGRKVISKENLHLEIMTPLDSAVVVCQYEDCRDEGIAKLLSHFKLKLDQTTLSIYRSAYRYSDKKTYTLYVYTAL